jgi:hypothetical protein
VDRINTAEEEIGEADEIGKRNAVELSALGKESDEAHPVIQESKINPIALEVI